jgi:DNA invertase Pin-like site-specific DNA recombinase
MSAHELVRPSHLARKAVIYIRQSTAQQVLSNLESQRMQRAMWDHAIRLGWPESRVEIVEVDTGHSGASTVGRQGYKKLLAEIVQSLVGIVLSYESARLSRNCGDWYRLLDACALSDCLIGDRDGVYDSSNSNGRLLLGMKGMLSEFELHSLRGRLVAGALNKARRGELEQNLPAGLVRLEDGSVVKDPDLAVQKAIDTVFSLFGEVGSACRVASRMRENGLHLPRRERDRSTVWRLPTASRIMTTLRNPAYAGAFVYGRSHNEHVCTADGTRTVRCRRSIGEWPVVLKDRHSAYVSWDEFERIQGNLKDNRAEYEKNITRGIPRRGELLLQGIAYCGTCGRKLYAQYSRHARYVCRHEQTKSGLSVCQSLLASPIDAAVVGAFFEALSPAELDIYDQAMEKHAKGASEIHAAQERELERLRYQAELARRRYEKVEPEHRLVARELERRWNQAMGELDEASGRIQEAREKHREAAAQKIPKELREALLDLGHALPGLWESETLGALRKKALLRCLIEKVVLSRESGASHIDVRIVWRGGADTDLDVMIDVGSMKTVPRFPEMERRILDLESQGLDDGMIAGILTREGFRSPRQKVVLEATVRVIRLARRRVHRYRKPRTKQVDGCLTVPQVAKRLGVRNEWVYHRIKTGKIAVTLDPKTGLYLFPDRPDVIQALRELLGSVSNGEMHQDE